jgi:hypothetical protein
MSGTDRYTLSFAFECPSAEMDALRNAVEKSLGKNVARINLRFKKENASTVLVTLTGDEKAVDSCHLRLSRDICGRYKSIRIADDLGNRLRKDAYAVISRVEDALRSFVNRAMTEALGFSWWEQFGNTRIKTRVAEVESKNPKVRLHHHTLDFSEFESL